MPSLDDLPDSARDVLEAHLVRSLKGMRTIGDPHRGFRANSPFRELQECQRVVRQIAIVRELADLLGYDLSQLGGAGQTWGEMLALAEVRIREWHGSIAFVAPPPAPPREPASSALSVWERLRLPWPAPDAGVEWTETACPPDEYEEFAGWNPDAAAEEFAAWDPPERTTT